MRKLSQRLQLVGIVLCSAFALPTAADAQLRSSAFASVSQMLDGTTITITYSRPRARGRTLERVFGGNGEWGKPWTPGANMATTLDVSRDVTVNGQAVAKGTYSVWMVPRQSGDWTVILDPHFRRYHSEGIDSTAAQIRFRVHTQEGPNTDALTWSILEVSPNAASLTMQWFTTRVTLDLKGQPSRASMISAEAAAAYVGRYDVTCNLPKEEICHRVAGASGTIPLLLSRENGRLTARYPAQNQSGPFILARNAKDEFVYAWYTSSEGDVVTEVPEWVTFKFRMASGRATGFEVRNYRNDLVAMGTRVAPPSSANATAQRILCHLRRGAQGEYDGTCSQFNTEVARLTVRPPAASEASVWRGTRTLVEGTPEPVLIDPRSGALAAGRDWLGISALKQDAASLEFSFDYETPTPSAVDVEILRRARAYLSDEAHWNRADKNNMAAAPSAGFDCPTTVARSMFCALYLSSLEVAGYYAHFRPAIDAVREAILTARKRPVPAPLVSFNNDSTTSLTDVQGVLESALKRFQGQPSTNGNVESQATQLVRTQLYDSSMIRRYVAHDRLRRAPLSVKRDAAAQLATALTDTSRLVRARALTALERLGPQAGLAVTPLIQIISDPRDPLRISAFHSFSRMDMGSAGQTAIPALKQATLDPNENIHGEAAAGLLAVGDTTDALPVLRALLKSDTDYHRLAAAGQLAALGERSAVPVLEELLTDSLLFRRAAAALKLGEMGSSAQGAVPSLIAMLSDTAARQYVLNGPQKERASPFAAAALAQVVPFIGAPLGIPLRARVEGSENSLRDDGLGVYAWGVDSAFIVKQGTIAFMLGSDNSPRGPLSSESRPLRRSLSFDLSRPVPGSGAIGRGVIRDNEAQIHIGIDPRAHPVRSLSDMPVSDSAISIERIEMHFRIDGELHILQMGPLVEGQLDRAWFAGMNGNGTTVGQLVHPSSDVWIVRAASGSVARLWNLTDRTHAVDRGLYNFSLRIAFLEFSRADFQCLNPTPALLDCASPRY